MRHDRAEAFAGWGTAQAPLDLDNLHLADLGAAAALEAGFELEALLLTGSCVDIAAASRDRVNPEVMRN